MSGEEPVFRNRLLVAANGLLLTDDFSEKVVTGVPMRAALQYRTEDSGPITPSDTLIADVTLRDADLRMARRSRARLLDLDARDVSLDGATAIEARLARVNLAGASMQGADGADMKAVLARDCDLSGLMAEVPHEEAP